jgi:hypothetical protein
MNYAFVPGIGGEFDALRQVLAQRANTQVFSNPGVVTVADFFTHLELLIQTLGLSKADDLIAGSHGTAEGELFLRLDSIVPVTGSVIATPAVYEDLVKVNASKSIQIPVDVATSSTNFRLQGCSLGSEETKPILQMLKQALVNAKSVSAPRYIHSLSSVDGGNSYYEFMKYEFWTFGPLDPDKPKPLPIPDRAALLTAFAAVGHKLFDGTAVPQANWDIWAPSAAKINLDPTISQKFAFGVPVGLQPGDTFPVPSELANWVSGVETITLPLQAGNTVPANDTAAAAALLLTLPNDPTFDVHYGYPVYQRYHFATLSDFTKGWHWRVSSVGTNQLRYIGTRYRYEMWIPVTVPGTDQLIYNYYPQSGAPTIHFTESNVPYKLFGIA